MIKPISMSGGQPNILLPLVIVVGISAIKDLVEDLKRGISDKEENESEVLAAENGKFVTKKWQDIKVGEIVKIMKD